MLIFSTLSNKKNKEFAKMVELSNASLQSLD